MQVHVCASMCVRVFTRVQACVGIHMPVHMCVGVCTYVHMCASLYMQVHCVPACVHVCPRVFTYVWASTCKCTVLTCAHVCAGIYMQMHVCASMCPCVSHVCAQVCAQVYTCVLGVAPLPTQLLTWMHSPTSSWRQLLPSLPTAGVAVGADLSGSPGVPSPQRAGQPHGWEVAGFPQEVAGFPGEAI